MSNSCTVKARVNITLEVDVGCFGNDWNLESLRKDAQRGLNVAMGHLQSASIKAGIRITDITTRDLVVYIPNELAP